MCKKHTCILPVTKAEASNTLVTLTTDAVLSEALKPNHDFYLMVDASDLPNSSMPVVLTDGTVTVPLTKVNGNVVRETQFKLLCLTVQKHWCQCGLALLHCFYGDDDPHVLVYGLK